MSQIVKSSESDAIDKIKNLILHGDLGKLSEMEKVNYYKDVCATVGLNPLTKPFEFMRLNGREVLYAGKNCAEQLRKNHSISIDIVSRDIHGDSYMVCSKATDPTGRYDTSMGAVSIAGLKGDALANAMMKAETKSKRRVTLSILGLGMLDETEVESIPNAQRPNNKIENVVPSAPVNARPKELQKQSKQVTNLHEELIKLIAQKGISRELQEQWFTRAKVKDIYSLDEGKVFNLIKQWKEKPDVKLDVEYEEKHGQYDDVVKMTGGK